MGLPLPRAKVEETSGGVNPIDAPPDDVCVFIGPCSKGPRGVVRRYNNFKNLATTHGCGPAVKAAAYTIGKTGATALFIGLDAQMATAHVSAVDTTNLTTPSLAPSVTGTPADGYEVVVEFTAAGTTGITGISYKYSLTGADGTFTSPAALGTGLTISPSGTGLTITVVTGKAVEVGDSFAFYTRPASSTVLPRTTTRADADTPSTATFTVTGTPEDDYEVLFEILVGGTRGATGIVYRYSLDGGYAYTPDTQLGTNIAVDLMDGEELSGLNVAIGAGTLDAGDVLSFNTTGPGLSDTTLNAAIDTADAGPDLWSFIHVVGPVTPTQAVSVAAELEKLVEDPAGATFTMAILSARDRSTAESSLVWGQRVAEEWVEDISTRLAVGGGYARITCPITGRRNRRPMAWVLVPEIISRELGEDPGWRGAGPLSSDVSIVNIDNETVEYDARFDDVVHAARLVTLTTRKKRGGLFVTRGTVKGSSTDDISRIPQRRVMNVASEIYRQVMEDQLNADLFVNAAGEENPGALVEEDCGIIDRAIKSAIAERIGEQVSNISVRVSRTDRVLTNGGKLTAEVGITGAAYIDSLEGKIFYVNPRLAALQVQGG